MKQSDEIKAMTNLRKEFDKIRESGLCEVYGEFGMGFNYEKLWTWFESKIAEAEVRRTREIIEFLRVHPTWRWHHNGRYWT